MNNNSKDRKWILLVIIAGAMLAVTSFYAGWYLVGLPIGYRRGQIDAAQGIASHLVIDGQVVHIEGPAPERQVRPKDIEGGSK